MRLSTNEFKAGLKVLLDGAPCAIIDSEFVKPGKGQAFVRIKYRNLQTNRVGEKTFKSGEMVDAADVLEIELQYLYNDGSQWYFMDPQTFEQLAIQESAMEDAKSWLKEQTICTVVLWNNTPLQVIPPSFVILMIQQTDPGVRGDTTSGGSKPATLETGAVVKVPLFVQEGEFIKVDTRNGSYVGRAKA